MRLPIRARLTAWYVLLAAVTLAGVGAFLVLKLRSDLRSTIDREVGSSISVIQQSYVAGGSTRLHRGQLRDAAPHERRRAGARRARPRARDARRRPGAGSDAPPRAPAHRHRRAPPWIRDADLGDTDQPYRVAASVIGHGAARQLVIVGESLSGVNEAVRKVLVLLLIVGPIVLAASAAAAWLLVRNALLPVDRMRRKANQIGIDELHERLSAPNPNDQIGRLAATLNAMLDRLQAGVSARRQLVADASHELRTPLAAMRAELDVTLRDPTRTPAERAALESVREDVDRMSRTVGNLLTLALADEGGLELLRAPVDLAVLSRAAVDPLRALAALGHVTLECVGESCWTTGDAQRLTQALRNLVENAIKFTPGGGHVTVSTWRRGDEAGVSVTDTGVGIDDAARARIFDRFYRADGSRSRQSGGWSRAGDLQGDRCGPRRPDLGRERVRTRKHVLARAARRAPRPLAGGRPAGRWHAGRWYAARWHARTPRDRAPWTLSRRGTLGTSGRHEAGVRPEVSVRPQNRPNVRQRRATSPLSNGRPIIPADRSRAPRNASAIKRPSGVPNPARRAPDPIHSFSMRRSVGRSAPDSPPPTNRPTDRPTNGPLASGPHRNVPPVTAAPDDHWPASSFGHVPRGTLSHCVLGQRPPDLAISRRTFR